MLLLAPHTRAHSGAGREPGRGSNRVVGGRRIRRGNKRESAPAKCSKSVEFRWPKDITTEVPYAVFNVHRIRICERVGLKQVRSEVKLPVGRLV